MAQAELIGSINFVPEHVWEHWTLREVIQVLNVSPIGGLRRRAQLQLRKLLAPEMAKLMSKNDPRLFH
ncbi:hypothetical protein KW783_02520 [Candidatus Parcubacteria bacterium]|nr:hypothetical protein [Candidatus Parcubacteria bacterium]